MSEAQRSKTVLGPDCRISGELTLDNDAVIMGHFKGTLRVTGLLELTDSSEVSGTIIAGSLRLAGHAEADVVAEEGVELLPGAQLVGQLYTSRLNVVEGAVFQGDVCVGPKAIQAATEALSQTEQVEEEPAEAPASYMMSNQHIDEQVEEEIDDEPKATTVPGSVNAILQRRRTKVLAARQSIGSNGR